MKLGDRADEGKSEIAQAPQNVNTRSGLYSSAFCFQLMQISCHDPRDHSGFLRLRTRVWSHCLRWTWTTLGPLSPTHQSIGALGTKGGGRANSDNLFYHFPSLGSELLHHYSVVVTLCQVQVPVWGLLVQTAARSLPRQVSPQAADGCEGSLDPQAQ